MFDDLSKKTLLTGQDYVDQPLVGLVKHRDFKMAAMEVVTKVLDMTSDELIELAEKIKES